MSGGGAPRRGTRRPGPPAHRRPRSRTGPRHRAGPSVRGPPGASGHHSRVRPRGARRTRRRLPLGTRHGRRGPPRSSRHGILAFPRIWIYRGTYLSNIQLCYDGSSPTPMTGRCGGDDAVLGRPRRNNEAGMLRREGETMTPARDRCAPARQGRSDQNWHRLLRFSHRLPADLTSKGGICRNLRVPFRVPRPAEHAEHLRLAEQ